MSGEDSNSHTRPEIGQTLEGARRERGLSLEQVEAATKIRARYLRALENENFDVLPAVYVLGSLKTYARYLGLDAEALTTELKHRQSLLQEQEELPQEEPEAGEAGGLLASLSRLFGVGSTETVEDDTGTVPDHGHSPRLYLSLGVVLIFVLATALASSLRAEDQLAVSQVSEPKTTQAPARIALVGSLDAGGNHTENRESQPENEAGASAKDSSKEDTRERNEQDEDAPITAQAAATSATASASASASESASVSARASAKIAASASTSTTSAPAKAAASASVGPKPEAKEEPDTARGAVDADASPGPPARERRGPALQHNKRAGPTDATALRNKIFSKVRSAVNSAR